MTNDIPARGFLEDAIIILEEAKNSFREKHYHRVVRKCQESAELSVKALFKWLGLEYPKAHLLGRLIKKELKRRDLFNPEALEKLAYYSDSLSLDREPAFYGSREGMPASALFDEEDAQEAIQKTEWIVGQIKKLLPPE